jgi:hypothetical protein
MNNNLEHLKKEYMETPIPEELDFMVRKSLMEGMKTMKKNARGRKIGVIAATAAAVIVVFTAGINISPAFASTMSKIPVIGNVVKVLTFKEYVYNDGNHNADIKVPSIEGLENKDLQNSLNEKYLTENKKLYEEFEAGMEEMKKNGDGHLGVDSGYEIKTDTDKILSVGRYVVNTVGSSSTTMKYDTIDKENEILITLPSLFKDASYIDVISENIKEQMLEQKKEDDNKTYWVEGIENEGITERFEKISAEQNFYITSEGKLVISFDKYEVAPGYMGIAEFEIPTDVISDILVSSEYIK